MTESSIPEFWAYLALIVITIGYTISNKTYQRSFRSYAWYLSLFFLYAFVVRLSGPDTDMVVYLNATKSSSTSIYYLKEPFVWLGLRWIYDLVGSDLWSVILLDLVSGTIIYLAFQNLRLPKYAFYSFLSFYPIILGFQNSYRQYFCALFLIWAISIPRKKIFKTVVVYIFALLSHNIGILYFLYVNQKFNFIASKALKYIVILLMPIALYIGKDIKSAGSTNNDTALLYIIAIFLIWLLFITMKKMGKRKNLLSISGFLLMFYPILLLCYFFLSSLVVERLAMMCMVLSYPFIVLYLEETSNFTKLWRICLIIFGFVPILMTQASHFVY